MKTEETISTERPVYYRLIALWVMVEAVLGGMIHGLKLPVSGLIVGSCAVLCICLIAYYVPARGAILKATVVVAIFKMMLSPQSPPAAYLAVFFQGAVGQLLFTSNRFFKLSCILLGFLALTESAVQRAIVLTVLYGTGFWKAVNEFFNKLTGESTLTNYSLLLVVAYLFIHVVTGVIVGWVAGNFAERSAGWRLSKQHQVISPESHTELVQPQKNKYKTGLLIVWLILLALTLQSYFRIGTPLLSSNIIVRILLRSVLIFLTWYFIVSPLLVYLLKKWLHLQQTKLHKTIREVVALLPYTQAVLWTSWKLSSGKSGWKRLKECCKIVLVNTLR
jgi:hypothetical protein